MNQDTAPDLVHRLLRRFMRDTLECVSGILRDHGFEFWLDRGTLLGAYRDGRLIPGDDDIDLRVMHSDWEAIAGALGRNLPDSLELVIHHHGATVHAPGGGRPYRWFCNDDGEFRVAATPGIRGGVSYHAPTAMTVVSRGQNIFRKPNLDLYCCLENDHHCCVPASLARPWTHDGRTYLCMPARRDHDIFMPVELVRPVAEIDLEGGRYPAPARVEEYLAWMFGYIGENAVHNRETGYWEPAPGQ